MEGVDVLTALGEVAIGIAGFSGIVFAIRHRDEIGEHASFRVLGLLITSFHTLFLAFLPLVIQSFGMEGSALWRTASAVGLLGTLPGPALMLSKRPAGYAAQLQTLTWIVGLLAWAALTLNVFVAESSLAFYLLAVFLTMLAAVPQFIAVLITELHE